MKISLRFSAGLLLVLVASAIAGPQSTPDPRLPADVSTESGGDLKAVVARVNSVPITQAQLYRYIVSRPGTGWMGSIEMQAALTELIDQLLILQAWDETVLKGAKFPEDVLDARIDTIVREEFSGDKNAFLTSIKPQSLEAFRERERNKLIIQIMIQSHSSAPDPSESATKKEKWLQSLRAEAEIKR